MLSGVEKYQHSCLLSLGLTTLTDNIINYAKKYPPLPLSYYNSILIQYLNGTLLLIKKESND